MSEEQEKDAQAPEAGDSATVQAALRGIPGLANIVGDKPPANPAADRMAGILDGAGGGAAGDAPAPEVEDSDTVKQALRQLGLK